MNKKIKNIYIVLFLLIFNTLLVYSYQGVIISETENYRYNEYGVSIIPPIFKSLTNTSANTTYLKLDASNDPITGNLDINANLDIEGNTTSSWFKGLFNWTINSLSNLWLSFNGYELSFNETKLNETGDSRYVNIDGDNMTGSLNISNSADLTVSGAVYIGTDSSKVTTPLSDGDTTIDGVLRVNNTISSFPQKYGVGFSVTKNGNAELDKSVIVIGATNAVINTTTGLFCDIDNPNFFENNATSFLIAHLFSPQLGTSQVAFNIIEFINSTCVNVNLAALGTDNVPDVYPIVYGIAPKPIFLITDNGFISSLIGSSYDSKFLIEANNATGSGKFEVDTTANDNNIESVRFQLDSNGFQNNENFVALLKSLSEINSSFDINIKIDGDLSNHNNSTYIGIDNQLIDIGDDNTFIGHRLSDNFKIIEQIVGQKSASRVYSDNDTDLIDLTNRVNNSDNSDTIFPENGTILYFGNTVNFTEISISLVTEASSSIEPIFYYCNSSGEWESFSVRDGTSGFTKTGSISFINPSNRGTCNKQLNGSIFPDTNNYTYVAIQRFKDIITIEPVLRSMIIFDESSRRVIGNDIYLSGANNALGIVNEENYEEGGISDYTLAFNSLYQPITVEIHQVGKNNSFSIWGNSLGVIPNFWGYENFTNNDGTINITNLTNYNKICDKFSNDFFLDGDSCNFNADTRGRGMPLLAVGDIEAWLSVFIHNGLSVWGDVNYNLFGNVFNVNNGSMRLSEPRVQTIGFLLNDRVTILNQNFEAGLSPFVRITTGGGVSEWTSISDPNCHDGTCARAIGGSLAPQRIMQVNKSTLDLDTLNVSLWITTLELELTDYINITVNNNEGTKVSLFENNTNLDDIQYNLTLPISMNNKSIVTLEMTFSANVANELVYIDDVYWTGNATKDTQQNITVQDANLYFGSGNDGCFYIGDQAIGESTLNCSADNINFIGNTTFINVKQTDLNITESITLNEETIINWDNVSNYDDNVVLRNGSRQMTNNWNTGTYNFSVDTNTLFVDSSTNRVGIGTINPTNTLEVNGIIMSNRTGSNGILVVNRAGAKVAALQAGTAAGNFLFDNTANFNIAAESNSNVLNGIKTPSSIDYYTFTDGLMYSNPDAIDIDFIFKTVNYDSIPALKIIGSDGSIGVHTNTPATEFDVNGTITTINLNVNGEVISDSLNVNGDVNISGCYSLYNGSIIGGACTSDESLKENIQDDILNETKITQLKVKTFDWINDSIKIGEKEIKECQTILIENSTENCIYDENNNIIDCIDTLAKYNDSCINVTKDIILNLDNIGRGFIAEDVEELYPDRVIQENGIKKVIYSFDWVLDLWNSVSDLIKENKEQENKITQLEEENLLIKYELCNINSSYSWC